MLEPFPGESSEQTDRASSTQSLEGTENGPELSQELRGAAHRSICALSSVILRALLVTRGHAAHSGPERAASVPPSSSAGNRVSARCPTRLGPPGSGPGRATPRPQIAHTDKAKRFPVPLRGARLEGWVETERKLSGKHPNAEQRKETDGTGGRAARPPHGEVSGEQSEALLPLPRGSGGAAAAPGATQEAAAPPRPAGTPSPAGRRWAAALTWHRGRGRAPRPSSFLPPSRPHDAGPRQEAQRLRPPRAGGPARPWPRPPARSPSPSGGGRAAERSTGGRPPPPRDNGGGRPRSVPTHRASQRAQRDPARRRLYSRAVLRCRRGALRRPPRRRPQTPPQRPARPLGGRGARRRRRTRPLPGPRFRAAAPPPGAAR